MDKPCRICGSTLEFVVRPEASLASDADLCDCCISLGQDLQEFAELYADNGYLDKEKFTKIVNLMLEKEVLPHVE